MTQPAGPGEALVPLTAFGVAVDVRCSGSQADALAESLRAAWSRCARDASVPAETTVAVDLDSSARPRIAGVMHTLAGSVTVAAISARKGRAIMLHAAGLALPDGRVVAFVAPSGTGKTTLARTLGTAFGYVSDETVMVLHDGSITAYPKPLSILRDGPTKVQLSPEALGLMPAPPALRLARVVLLDRRPDAAGVTVGDVPLLPGIAELAAQVSYLSRLPTPLQSVARMLEGTGGLARVTYAEAELLADAIPQLVGDAS